MINDKEITEYLFTDTDTSAHITHQEYTEFPGTAFLKFCLEAKDSIEFCKEHFPKHRGNNRPKQESIVRIQHIVNSTLALMTGHLETYQKYLFAGTFERTIYFEQFNSENFFKIFGDRNNIEITANHLMGYRGEAMTAGILLADNIGSWHNPEQVNKYFKAFGFNNLNFYSNEDISDLKVIWQLRHSIVHTAATLTRSDAQKVPDLIKFSGKNIVFTNKFIYELTKRLHSLVYKANGRLQNCVENKLRQNIKPQSKTDILQFYNVNSRNSMWLR